MNQEIIQKAISVGIRRLRKEKRITQVDLAKVLGLSQAQLSKIENSAGSITAEQLIQLLKKYGLSLSYFISLEKDSKYHEDPALQNALVHLGATHLRLISDVVVPEKFAFPEEVLLAVLVAPSSRLVTALAPVIVQHCETIHFHRVAEKLRGYGIEYRLWWVVDGTYDAIGKRLKEPALSRDLYRAYQRAFLLLERKKLDGDVLKNQLKEDELDTDLISEKTVQSVKLNRDKLAKHWHIITRIKETDFEQALKDSEEV